MAQSGLVISRIQDVTVVNFRNTAILDGAAVDAAAEELYALVDQQAKRKIILDFSNVRFLSSTMLGVLIVLHKKICSIKGKFVICGLRGDLTRVFKITRLDKILTFAADEEKAMNSFDVFTRP